MSYGDLCKYGKSLSVRGAKIEFQKHIEPVKSKLYLLVTDNLNYFLKRQLLTKYLILNGMQWPLTILTINKTVFNASMNCSFLGTE